MIDLVGDDADTVERMLSYLYTLDYDDGGGGSGIRSPGDGDNDDDDDEHALFSSVIEAWRPADEAAATQSVRDQHGQPINFGRSPSSEQLPDPTTLLQHLHSERGAAGVALHNHVRVYAMADKYGVLELKELAKRKFTACADCDWPTENLAEILRAVYGSTPESDRGLRDVVARLCSNRLHDLIHLASFTAVLVEEGALCLDVLRRTLIRSDKLLQDQDHKVRELQRENKTLADDLATQTAHVDLVQRKFENAFRTIALNPSCRHCFERFRPVPEGGYGPNDHLVLRCSDCRTRHYT